MLVHVFGAKCVGIDAVRVTVEVDITHGIGIHLCGLADVAVKESLLRTTTALQALGFHIPGKRIVINLAPADMHKCGSGYDLPIALGIIAASEQRCFPNLEKYLIMGELGLDGSVRDISGALPIAEMAAAEKFGAVILPAGSALEASDTGSVPVFGVGCLDDVIRILEEKEDCGDLLVRNTQEYRKAVRRRHHNSMASPEVDFSEIIGQEGAKRGLEIAAAGSHNIIFLGSPGSGKSSLAKALAGILPTMSLEESTVTSKIYSIAGRRDGESGLVRRRPFRAPHYSISIPALVGGGSGDNILPGEVSLSHNGVLFLDEMAQMPRSVIEALRGPLEDRKVTVSRLRTKVEYPASFMLVAASNPCPCGYWGEDDRCSCTPAQRVAYLSKLSGPLMDRIDIQIRVSSVRPSEIAIGKTAGPEPSSVVAERVRKARQVQRERFASEDIFTNAEMNNRQIERFCPLTEECRQVLVSLMERTGLSMRAYFRTVRVARTIADLDGSEEILPKHLVEAAGYRFLDRKGL